MITDVMVGKEIFNGKWGEREMKYATRKKICRMAAFMDWKRDDHGRKGNQQAMSCKQR
jgi:hypothetical protein